MIIYRKNGSSLIIGCWDSKTVEKMRQDWGQSVNQDKPHYLDDIGNRHLQRLISPSLPLRPSLSLVQLVI